MDFTIRSACGDRPLCVYLSQRTMYLYIGFEPISLSLTESALSFKLKQILPCATLKLVQVAGADPATFLLRKPTLQAGATNHYSPYLHIKLFGGASQDRTDDLLIAGQALSQLSYGPTTTF